MSITPVAECKVFYKYRSEGLERLRLGLVLNRVNEDSNSVDSGIQNAGRIPIDFDATEYKYDLLYVSYNADGIGRTPRLGRTIGLAESATALDADADDLDFEIDPATQDTDPSLFVTGAIIQVEDEYMVIDTITKSTTWSITVAERGAHGSGIAAHSSSVEVSVWQWNCPHKELAISNYATAPTTPTSLNVVGQTEKFHCWWTWSPTDTLERTFLREFRVYYSVATPVTTSDNYVTSKSADKFLTPVTVLGYPDSVSDYYFAVSAVNVFGNESTLSTEVGPRKMYATVMPPDDDTLPVTPDVSVDVTGSYRMRVTARKPTSTKPGTIVENVKTCEFEFYFATTGLGNPTAGTPDGDQQLISSEVDVATPYELYKAVSAYGLGDYWGRARFTNDLDVVGAWGFSAVFNLNVQNATTDTAIPDTLTVAQDIIGVLGSSVFGEVFNQVLLGCAAANNIDSAYLTTYQLRIYEGPAVNFSTTLGFIGALRKDTELTYPNAWTFLEDPHYRFEVTAAVTNVYGRSLFTTPIELDMELTYDPPGETTTPTISEFKVYTKDNPPTPADPNLRGGMIGVDVKLGANNASTFWLIIQGHSTTWPTETVYLYDGTVPTPSLVPLTGTMQVTISGHTATSSEFDGKWLRLGNNDGDGVNEAIQEFLILSHTTGDPFTITLGGQETVHQVLSPLPHWEIIDEPVYKKVDYFSNIRVDASGRTEGEGGVPNADGYLHRIYKSVKGPRSLYFRMQGHNVIGRGARTSTYAQWIYADTSAGTYTGPGSLKSVPGIGPGDVDASVSQPELTADFYIDPADGKLKWTAGTIYYGEGSSASVNENSTGVTISAKTWVGYTVGDPNLATYTSLTTLAVSGKFIIGLAAPGTPLAMWMPYLAGKITVSRENLQADIITANEITVAQLSAISADMGTITAGIITGALIRTAATGARIQLVSTLHGTVGFYGIDSGGFTRVLIPADADKIVFYDATGAAQGHLRGSATDGLVLDLATNVGALLGIAYEGTAFAQIIPDVAGTSLPAILKFIDAHGGKITTSAGDLTFDPVGNDVIVGNSASGKTLQVVSTNSTAYVVITSAAGQIRGFQGTTAGSLRWDLLFPNNTAEGGSDAGSDFQLRRYDDSAALLSTPLFVKRSTGYVGMGVTVTSPATNLDLRGAGIASGSLNFQHLIYDTASYALGVGGGICFGGRYKSDNSLTYFGGIQCEKENATDDNYSSCLTFHTRLTSNAITEKVRIDSAGQVGIGNTPGKQLDVTGDVRSSSQFISTLAIGTKPLDVTSTTVCTNLNADMLDGNHASAFVITPYTGGTFEVRTTTNPQLRITYDVGVDYCDFYVDGDGDLLINPTGMFSVGAVALIESTTTPQLSLLYDVTKQATFSVSSAGNLTINTIGGYLYLNSQFTITETSSPQVEIKYDASHYLNINVESSGAVWFTHAETLSIYKSISLMAHYWVDDSNEAAVLTMGDGGAGSYRGGLILHRKTSGTDCPGTLGLVAADGGVLYCWNSNEDDLKVSTSIPYPGTGDTDGFRLGPNVIQLVDGVTAPGTMSGRASIYVDTADGDLKVKFGDGTVKTLATDT